MSYNMSFFHPAFMPANIANNSWRHLRWQTLALYLALYPALTTLDTESCVMPLAAKIKKSGDLGRDTDWKIPWRVSTLCNFHEIWLWNGSEITSLVAASSLHTFIHILGVIQVNCHLDVSSYIALFANWQIVDTYINLLLMSLSIAIHFCCVPFPKLGNEPCDFCRYAI